MIFVGGVPLSTDSSSSSDDVLICLLAHPVLVSASRSFSTIPERKFSSVLEDDEANLESSKPCNHVYVFQREYATADPKHVQFVGTDEATTCVGIAIRNSKNGMTSVAHIDSRGVVDIGLSQMLSSVVSPGDVDAVLDVHVVGAFDDAIAIAPQHEDTNSGGHRRPLEGFSVPHTDRFVIAPTTWAQATLDHASTTVPLSDQEILLTCSSSPLAEGPAFVENQRRLCEYLVKRPDWSETFPLKKPRTFGRSADGQWTMIQGRCS